MYYAHKSGPKKRYCTTADVESGAMALVMILPKSWDGGG